MSDDKKGKVPTVEYVENGSHKAVAHHDSNNNNPLSGLTPEELHERVEAFCGKYGFEEKLETFHKASLVAQRPHDFESIQELSEDDRHWLRREITSKQMPEVPGNRAIRGSC
jgi:hypothetical protein